MSHPDEKRAARTAEERRAWWQLRECYARCVQVARDVWDAELASATAEQYALALTMRDRTAPGVRATGKEYDMDRHVPVPLFTPRDKLQFLKEVATTLLIQASQSHLPVTPEGKRATQETNGPGDTVDAALEVEANELAEAGETPAGEAGGLAVSGAPAPGVPTVGTHARLSTAVLHPRAPADAE